MAKDIEMAKKVIARDDVIDTMFDDTKKEVIELIQNHGAGAEVANRSADGSQILRAHRRSCHKYCGMGHFFC